MTPEIVRALINALRDSNGAVRRSAALPLNEFDSIDGRFAKRLINILAKNGEFICYHVLIIFGKIKPRTEKIEQALRGAPR